VADENGALTFTGASIATPLTQRRPEHHRQENHKQNYGPCRRCEESINQFTHWIVMPLTAPMLRKPALQLPGFAPIDKSGAAGWRKG
jgi:hypothetical protein